MRTARRVAALIFLGAIGGALATAAAGVGYVITDQQHAYRRNRNARARATHPTK